MLAKRATLRRLGVEFDVAESLSLPQFISPRRIPSYCPNMPRSHCLLSVQPTQSPYALLHVNHVQKNHGITANSSVDLQTLCFSYPRTGRVEVDLMRDHTHGGESALGSFFASHS